MPWKAALAMGALFAATVAEKQATHPSQFIAALNVSELIRSFQKRIQCAPAGLTTLECIECLSARRLLDLAPAGRQHIQSSPPLLFQQLSVVLLYHLANLKGACRDHTKCSTYRQCRTSLMRLTLHTDETSALLKFEDILRNVKDVYTTGYRPKCFTAESILADMSHHRNNKEKFVENLSGAVIRHLADGKCIEVGNAVTDFLEDLFLRYGDQSTETMTQKGLECLMKRLKFSSDSIKQENGGRNHTSHRHDDQEHSHDDRHNGSDDSHHPPRRNEHEPHNHFGSGHEDHAHTHHDHDHSSPVPNEEHDITHQDEHDHIHNHHDHEEHHTHRLGHSDHSKQDPLRKDDHLTQSESPAPYFHETLTPRRTTLPSMHDVTSTPHPPTSKEKAQETTPRIHEVHISDHDHHPDKETEEASHHSEAAHLWDPHPAPLDVLKIRRSAPELHHETEERHEHSSSAAKCWTTPELIRRFSQSTNGSITKQEFFQLCPALVQQAVTDVCKHTHRTSPMPSTLELYGYGTMSVAIITVCSLVGILLLPCLARASYQYIMMTFIGLSFGAMVGDALLHLLPQVLGLHSHGEGGYDHDDGGHNHQHDDEGVFVPPFFWKQLGLLAVLYGLFLFESISALITGEDASEKNHSGHSHMPANLPEQLQQSKITQKAESRSELAQYPSRTSLEPGTSGLPQVPVLKSNRLCCGMSTLATVIIIGGAVHNVADGLAIGAAFTSGVKDGLSTSVAVFCHELPHEFGDFVVLMSTGLGYRKALLLNLLSGLAAFGGLYAGFQVGDDLVARNWILTVTAGVFLYVALVDMLPELKKYRGESPVKLFLCKNVGILLGVAFMCLIAIYEDRLDI